MGKKRGHGEGSIYLRKDGRWTASITTEGRKRKYISGSHEQDERCFTRVNLCMAFKIQSGRKLANMRPDNGFLSSNIWHVKLFAILI